MLLLRICNLSKCCCWATCYVNYELLGWVDFNQGCSCGGSVGVVGVPVFHPLSLCLEVYLLSTMWFGINSLILQLICRLLARNIVIYSLIFWGFLEICEVAICHLNIPSYTCLWFCSTLETIHTRLVIFLWIICNTIETCICDN